MSTNESLSTITVHEMLKDVKDTKGNSYYQKQITKQLIKELTIISIMLYMYLMGQTRVLFFMNPHTSI